VKQIAHAEADRLHDKVQLGLLAQQHDVRVGLVPADLFHQLEHRVVLVATVAYDQVEFFGLERRGQRGLVLDLAIIDAAGGCNQGFGVEDGGACPDKKEFSRHRERWGLLTDRGESATGEEAIPRPLYAQPQNLHITVFCEIFI